jgi:hypothetical protein
LENRNLALSPVYHCSDAGKGLAIARLNPSGIPRKTDQRKKEGIWDQSLTA